MSYQNLKADLTGLVAELNKYSDEVMADIDREADKTKSVQLTFSMNKLVVNASSPDAGTATQELDVEYNGDASFTVTFNVKFLMDVAGQVEGEKFQMEMQDPLSPTIIKSTNKDTDALFILMPMRM